jgi:ribonuclease HII
MLEPYYRSDITEAGCDEAGRGCLAGPVYAAAVILPPGFSHPELNDSKQLTKRKRDTLRALVEKEALAWAVASCSPQEIDTINILNASILAMHRAISQLKITPGHLIIDGNRFKPYPGITHQCFVKGDGRFLSIAAASVLAKTHRDEFMEGLHEKFPEYGWLSNKGYPSASHREAIKKYGTCEWHRISFKLSETQLKLEF